MACTTEFIEFVCDALAPLGEVCPRRMMGDYIIYLNDKCLATACDNNLYIKILPCIDGYMQDAEIGRPYDGAKEHYILDCSNQNFVLKVVPILWQNLPYPKKRTKK